MSLVKANTYQDASGGSNAVFSGVASPPNSMGFRNRIINGNMVIDQRNAGASVTPTSGAYTLDRWAAGLTQASKFSVQRSTDAPTGFTNSLLVTSLSAYSVTGNDYFGVYQYVEGFNVADLGYGAAGAATVTFSFWVKSSLTGSFGGSLENGAQNRCYSFAYTISAANTWEYKTVTAVGDTTGTWAKDNSAGFTVWFGLGAAGTRVGTAGSWGTQSASGLQPSGTTSVVGTNGATFYITGVQLEAGTNASAFEQIDYGRELMMCQRYYVKFGGGVTYGTIGTGQAGVTTGAQIVVPLPVEMRATPTVSGANLSLTDHQTNTSVSSVAVMSNQTNNKVGTIEATVASGLTQYRPYQLRNNNNAAGYVDYSAEL